MKRALIALMVAFVLGYCGTMGLAIIVPIEVAHDCDGCSGSSTTETCQSGGACTGSVTLGVDCSKCCDGTTCYKKEGYGSTPGGNG